MAQPRTRKSPRDRAQEAVDTARRFVATSERMIRDAEARVDDLKARKRQEEARLDYALADPALQDQPLAEAEPDQGDADPEA